jgi:hypothetical protein
MIHIMHQEAWLNQDHQFPPGREVFRSERSFAVWAYTVSHSQLLLRTRTAGGQPRIDVLFKPVEAMKIRTDFDGLVIRCATPAGRTGSCARLDTKCGAGACSCWRHLMSRTTSLRVPSLEARRR